MVDAQRDQYIRIQIGVHVSMEIRAEFVIPGDIGLDQCLPGAQAIALGLAHQRFCDGRNGGLAFDRPVRIDIGDLGIPQAQNIDGSVGVVYIAGDFPPHHFEFLFIKADRQTAEAGQVGDQIACGVVGGPQHIGERLTLHVKFYDNILFFIQIKMSESCHILPHVIAASFPGFYRFTTLTGLPSIKALILSAVISMMRCLAACAAQEICGVMMQFFALRRGLSPLTGSVETTSRPAA